MSLHAALNSTTEGKPLRHFNKHLLSTLSGKVMIRQQVHVRFH